MVKVTRGDGGQCYGLSYHALLDGDDVFYPLDGRVRLVHGEPILTVEPFGRFGHAWLEFETNHGFSIVYDVPTKFFLLRNEYYKAGKIDARDCQFYTLAEATEMADRYGVCGPWEVKMEMVSQSKG